MKISLDALVNKLHAEAGDHAEKNHTTINRIMQVTLDMGGNNAIVEYFGTDGQIYYVRVWIG